jgi:hypothetical protein
MVDTITLNPTEYLIIVLGCFALGFLSNYLFERLIDRLNKKYYLKGNN